MRTIKKIEIDFGLPEGSWHHDAVLGTTGGKPLPSESQAYVFNETIVPALEKFLNLPWEKIEEFLSESQ